MESKVLNVYEIVMRMTIEDNELNVDKRLLEDLISDMRMYLLLQLCNNSEINMKILQCIMLSMRKLEILKYDFYTNNYVKEHISLNKKQINSILEQINSYLL